jgi:hypothetical protein
MKLSVVPIVLFLFVVACDNAPKSQQATPVDSSNGAGTTALQLDGIERIELFFYPDPADRKNVQQLQVTDTTIIAAFKQSVLQDTMTQSECPHDVKMFLIRNGEVFKTVYGATSDSCSYLAYAINSKPYYTRLDQDAKAFLDSLRDVAK